MVLLILAFLQVAFRGCCKQHINWATRQKTPTFLLFIFSKKEN